MKGGGCGAGVWGRGGTNGGRRESRGRWGRGEEGRGVGSPPSRPAGPSVGTVVDKGGDAWWATN